ncbi:MAG: response regulator, partial [Blastocatellia bacterium]
MGYLDREQCQPKRCWRSISSSRISPPGLVLVIDDSPVQLGAVCRVLEQAGFVQISARDCESGLALARQAMPELIISDVVMPRMDGIELCRKLKSDPATADIPVLLFSALDYNDARLSEGFDAGADDYIEVTAPRLLLSKKAERLVAQYREKRARKDAEERYRSLVESLPVVVYAAEAEPPYSTIYVSPAIESLGYPLADWYSGAVSWMELLHPDDRDRILTQTAAADVETYYEYRMIARDGSVRWFHDHGRFVTSGDEESCKCWQGIMTDITERKKTEEALRDSQAFYESLVESLPQS